MDLTGIGLLIGIGWLILIVVVFVRRLRRW